MEGLIPLLMHAVKKPKPQNSYRSVSTRSYHVLVGADAKEDGSPRSGFGCMPQSRIYQRNSTGLSANSYQVSGSRS
ncbi:hypothetical protein HanIR_Chr08g0363091 [Helianthus annuus]|nr:hypothetical protein HanIR_Chr08g0363091 [Helianthus annuus]